MTTDYLIDGMLSGTGLRDTKNGGYVEPLAVGLSASLTDDLIAWQKSYEDAHFSNFPITIVNDLDREGIALSARAQVELPGKKIGYFSNGLMKRMA
ncbi:hypothetical protein [Novosphingobium olei]|uniref:Uncharacterized protein n=1 Tax=Novosphingobium olei TaxID=2728851 RepID=A0A7Y0BLZ1_9SPHN|nr:hypothetical protein [Novosphingobium olei]NML92665.1 hypothetical protein [Novosphingobium olei]